MLFHVAIDWTMRETIGNKRRRIRWTLTSTLEDIDFADHLSLLCKDQIQEKTGDLQRNGQLARKNATEKDIDTSSIEKPILSHLLFFSRNTA